MSEQTHWGPDPGRGGLTQHKGSRADCSGPDCGSDEGSHFHQATQRLEASDWQWQEHGFKGALREAIVAQVHSNLAVAFELRRLNEDRSQWYREVLEVLTQAKEPEGSLRSGQPEAAPGGQEPWFAVGWPGWHFPDPDHPSSRDFPEWAAIRERYSCALCGAPLGARCVTRQGRPTPNHPGRRWVRTAHDDEEVRDGDK